MTKKVLRLIAAVLLSAIIVAGTMVTAFAETSQYVPYENYTYWEDITGSGRKLVYNRPMYNTQFVLSNVELGIEAFTELVDVCTDKNENIYLLDTGSPDVSAKIVVLDANYKYVKQISKVYKETTAEDGTVGTEELDFTGAYNIYVHTDGCIYICDTTHARVLKCDGEGRYIDEYTLPDSPLIPDDFTYRPVKVVADSRGYVYILSEGSYYGALLFAPAESGTAKEFIGFYGANTVVNGVLGAIQSALNRMFPNNDKMKNQNRVLPYTFSDIVIDSKDFIYTTTDSAAKGQLKKLNPGAGNNILKSNDKRFIDDAVNRTYLGGLNFALYQKIVGLDVDDKEFMYALDATYGRIYLYDAQCRLLTTFGGGMGSGTQKGTFQTASAICVKETKDENGTVIVNDVLVTDKTNNTLTVFRRNDYGNMVVGLTRMTIDGDYVESREGWEEAIKLDKNLQIAYTGLARAYLAEKNYEKAMEVALEGYDRDTYALAFEYHRQNLVSKYFGILFAAVIVIALAVIAVVVFKKKKGEAEVSGDSEWKLALSALIHPGLAFEEMKDKKRGSVKVALVILLLFYVSAVIQVLWGGFLFTKYDPGTFNSLWVLVQSVGLVALWVIANWLVTTLMAGKGKLKEIFVVTCYSLMPIIGARVIYIVLTNFLLPTEGSFLGILTTAAMIYTGLLLVIGMMRIHDYSMGRLIGTSLLSVFGMAAIIFLMILVGILLQQLGGFVATIVTELLM
ncbi:MAG: YIP1 family protein [Clostridia bacterium]|nr:YIP1 family protein [Clostridia bacterium]